MKMILKFSTAKKVKVRQFLSYWFSSGITIRPSDHKLAVEHIWTFSTRHWQSESVWPFCAFGIINLDHSFMNQDEMKQSQTTDLWIKTRHEMVRQPKNVQPSMPVLISSVRYLSCFTNMIIDSQIVCAKTIWHQPVQHLLICHPIPDCSWPSNLA